MRYSNSVQPNQHHWSDDVFATTLITFVYIALHFMIKLSNIAHLYHDSLALNQLQSMHKAVPSKNSYWELHRKPIFR